MLICTEDKKQIFSILQHAFDNQMANEMLKPEEGSNSEVWKDEGFYKLLVTEEETRLVGSFVGNYGDEVDYRISFAKDPNTEGIVHVICVCDDGLYAYDFSNSEIACIVSYFNLKIQNNKFCFKNKEEK